jgi:hypothetical protein
MCGLSCVLAIAFALSAITWLGDRVDPKGVARYSLIYEICGGEVMKTKNIMNMTHKSKGKLTHTRYTPVVLVGPIHQLNRITRKRLQE